MNWLMLNMVPLLNIVGLACDMLGAVLVAIEVVRQYRGERFKPNLGIENNSIYVPPGPEETTKYRGWEIRKYKTMKLGLIFLLLGFALQIYANFLQLK